MISSVLLSQRELAGVHFTGSTEVFNSMWETIGRSMSSYRSYRASVGETGGKTSSSRTRRPTSRRWRSQWSRGVRYQGRSARRPAVSTCRSRCGRRSATGGGDDRDIKMGDVRDFRNFMGAVIDKKAFTSISAYVARRARRRRSWPESLRRLEGLLHQSTLVETRDPGFPPDVRGIFGPCFTAYAYDDDKVEGDAGAGGIRRRRMR